MKHFIFSISKEMPEGKLRIVPPVKAKFTFFELFTPSLRMITFLLWVIWFCNTFSYYGLVLLAPSFFENKIEHDPDARIRSNQVYLDVFITSCAELPGLLLAGSMLDKVGRKGTQSLLFAICGVFTLLFVILNK